MMTFSDVGTAWAQKDALLFWSPLETRDEFRMHFSNSVVTCMSCRLSAGNGFHVCHTRQARCGVAFHCFPCVQIAAVRGLTDVHDADDRTSSSSIRARSSAGDRENVNIGGKWMIFAVTSNTTAQCWRSIRGKLIVGPVCVGCRR